MRMSRDGGNRVPLTDGDDCTAIVVSGRPPNCLLAPQRHHRDGRGREEPPSCGLGLPRRMVARQPLHPVHGRGEYRLRLHRRSGRKGASANDLGRIRLGGRLVSSREQDLLRSTGVGRRQVKRDSVGAVGDGRRRKQTDASVIQPPRLVRALRRPGFLNPSVSRTAAVPSSSFGQLGSMPAAPRPAHPFSVSRRPRPEHALPCSARHARIDQVCVESSLIVRDGLRLPVRAAGVATCRCKSQRRSSDEDPSQHTPCAEVARSQAAPATVRQAFRRAWRVGEAPERRARRRAWPR